MENETNVEERILLISGYGGRKHVSQIILCDDEQKETLKNSSDIFPSIHERLLNYCKEKQETLLAKSFGVSISEPVYKTMSADEFHKCIESIMDASTTSIELDDLADFEPKEESISSIKKQIKNCKNPMQLRELNRRLNELYKGRKRNKRV